MEQTGTFINGIIDAAGNPCREFTITERTFRHTLELANDRSIDLARINEPVYSDAAMIARRLTVPGIPAITPEMILDLDGEDGDCLAGALTLLDHRRAEFRKEQQAAAQASAGTP